MSAVNTVVVKNLSKSYGNFLAINKINFSVEKGTIHGLLGENGAGKTTTMRCLLGLSYSDYGEMYINQEKISKKNHKIRRNTSNRAGNFRPYENIKPMEYFKYILKLKKNKSDRYWNYPNYSN